MRYYPTLLDLRGRACLVVGAGRVGLRKIDTLLECGPERVVVIDPRPAPEHAARLRETPGVELIERSFQESDLAGLFLVIAASGAREANEKLAALCREKSILCNVADDPDSGSFIVPATLELDDLLVSVSSQGASPALARVIKRDLHNYLCSRYELLLALMARVRPLVLALNNPTDDNTEVFRGLVRSDLGTALREGDRIAAETLLREGLPPTLHNRIGELLDGLA